MSKFFNFLLGFLLGAAFAAALVMLLTPQSGTDLQKQVKDKVQYIKVEVDKARQERKSALEKELDALRHPKS